MNKPCNCCAGIQQQTPLAIFNRPGLAALTYRVGTHASFLETMVTTLSNLPIEAVDAQGNKSISYPLKGLTTRESADPSLALLDAWATVADVLTFYQERMANEGYLRTATEHRSLLELAKLVGYTLCPGVAASVYLAYTLENDQNVTLLAGNRVQSLPGSGELPQSFETAEPLEARSIWNVLMPLLTRSQFLILQRATSSKDFALANTNKLYCQGTATRLNPADLLLLLTDDEPATGRHRGAIHQVATTEAQTVQSRTKVTLQALPGTTSPVSQGQSSGNAPLTNIVGLLAKQPSPQPSSTQRLERDVSQVFSPQSAIYPQLLKTVNSALTQTLDTALSHAALVSAQSSAYLAVRSVQAFRIKAALFGNNVSSQYLPASVKGGDLANKVSALQNKGNLLPLDTSYDQIVPGSWVVIRITSTGSPPATVLQTTSIIRKVTNVQTIALSPYDVFNNSVWNVGQGNADAARFSLSTATKITLLTLDAPWLQDWLQQQNQPVDLLSLLRGTTIYAQSEELPLADISLAGDDGDSQVSSASPIQGDVIELDQLYPDLKSGRWLIVSGERADLPGVSGVIVSELALLAGITQDVHKVTSSGNEPGMRDNPALLVALPGGKLHTFLHLAQPLAYVYKRNTVTIAGNVVRATHGETHEEVLGSGDGSKALQRFSLRQPPLTYVSAPTQNGAKSTLQVRVNDILWQEVDDLGHLQPTDRAYLLETDDAGKTSVIFGNGKHGARLPTSIENVQAVYRSGVGTPGNVKAGQISMLATRPLGVKSVINPLPATGGADAETLNQARSNVPFGLLSEERLISVQDYANFARVFAGVDKACATKIGDGQRQYIHISIAGAGNMPIDPSSDIYRNLLLALHNLGDPHIPLQLAVCEVVMLIIDATIHLQAGYLWEPVEAAIRSALLEAFSFERRQLGQPIFQSEVLGAIQAIPGVDYADMRRLDVLDQEKLVAALSMIRTTGASSTSQQVINSLIAPQPHDIVVKLARRDPTDPNKILPAQLAFLSPDEPDTLILNPYGVA